MQWVDMNMYDGDPLARNPLEGHSVPGARVGPVSILRMFGVTQLGNSVLAHIHGFTPYFWTSPPPGMTPADVPAFQASLEAQLTGSKGKFRLATAVLSVQLVPDKQSILGYHGGRKQSVLQIYVGLPGVVPAARGVLERGFAFGRFPTKSYLCFEANVPFELRFMIDTGMVGSNWCEFPAGAYSVRPVARKVSHVQLELDIVYDSVVSHVPDGVWQRLAPLRILSFDIECMGRKGHFPEAEHDPVIQIASVVTLQGASTSILRNVLTLGETSPIVGAQVMSFAREEDLVRACARAWVGCRCGARARACVVGVPAHAERRACPSLLLQLDKWAELVREVDPDIITGYNVQNFDIPYILNRARKLKREPAQMLGRIRNVKAVMRDTTFTSAAFGKHENVDTTVDGRVLFCMLQYMRREHKLSSYSLNSVSAHFLGQQKEDVHHSIISDLQKGTPDDRRRLAV